MASTDSLGLFGSIPFEIRCNIYSIIFEGQVIHCCSAKGISDRHGIAGAASPLFPCGAKAFQKECVECSESDHESVPFRARVARWSNVISYGDSHFTPADCLSLFLVCRTFWHEAEPQMWNSITLNTGLPQFCAFYGRFLGDQRDTHPVGIPRGRLLRNLQIVIPNHKKLGSVMGQEHGNVYYNRCKVNSMIKRSIVVVADCTRLRSVSVMIAASLASQMPNPEGTIFMFGRVINLLLGFPRPLSHVAVNLIGQLRHPNRPHGDNYDDLPDDDACKILISLLAQHLRGTITLQAIPRSALGSGSNPGVIDLRERIRGRLEGMQSP